jgi:zinc and cadmium transporter
MQQLIAFAAGVMLSSACLDILPEALAAFIRLQPDRNSADAATQMFATLLAGLLLFFTLEHLALWRHTHPEDGMSAPLRSARSAATLILIGDGFHNFVDGILIAAAFLTNTALGISTTLAIIAHEIPQELGDFALLLNAGWQKRRALLANGASSLTSLLGGILGYFFLEEIQSIQPYVLAFAAASFLYIAIADLLPALHGHVQTSPGHQAF